MGNLWVFVSHLKLLVSIHDAIRFITDNLLQGKVNLSVNI